MLHCIKGGLLDWPTRFKIALDAAEGLSYLHHDCVPAIVHRDVKSNNILLDGDFGARVADFEISLAGQPFLRRNPGVCVQSARLGPAELGLQQFFIVVSNSVKLGVALEGVDRTLGLDGVGALNIVVIREKDLFWSREIASGRRATPPADGVERSSRSFGFGHGGDSRSSSPEPDTQNLEFGTWNSWRSCQSCHRKRFKLSGGAIAGIVIGSVLAFLVIVMFLIFFCRKKKSKKTSSVNIATVGSRDSWQEAARGVGEWRIWKWAFSGGCYRYGGGGDLGRGRPMKIYGIHPLALMIRVAALVCRKISLAILSRHGFPKEVMLRTS
ncbi:hypothetical protein FF1_046507 [Malus domestica]